MAAIVGDDGLDAPQRHIGHLGLWRRGRGLIGLLVWIELPGVGKCGLRTDGGKKPGLGALPPGGGEQKSVMARLPSAGGMEKSYTPRCGRSLLLLCRKCTTLFNGWRKKQQPADHDCTERVDLLAANMLRRKRYFMNSHGG